MLPSLFLLPQDAQGAEEREALARMAANVEDAASADSEAYIEKYLRSVLAVENILTLDRLRQVCSRECPESSVCNPNILLSAHKLPNNPKTQPSARLSLPKWACGKDPGMQRCPCSAPARMGLGVLCSGHSSEVLGLVLKVAHW